MSVAFLLGMGAALGVRLPRSLRPLEAEPEPKLDEEAQRRIDAARAKRERKRKKRLDRGAP